MLRRLRGVGKRAAWLRTEPDRALMLAKTGKYDETRAPMRMQVGQDSVAFTSPAASNS
jgi:hypothetical protein